MTAKPYYITTPIYYPSDRLHIGHAYCTTIADSLARYKRLAGFDVFFLTGSDEHGQKIQRKAQENNITPIQYVDKIVASFQHLWQKLNISNDDFIRTTEKRHPAVVQKIFTQIYEQGDIYKAEYEGWYCTPCETFWLEGKLKEGMCPDCGRAVEMVKEESYFFRLSKYQNRLLEHIENNPEFIQPVSRRNEMINFIKNGLEDLCVSRTTFDWGIPVPFDTKHVVYVWFDALVNYLTAAGYLADREKFTKFWPADVHLVGKEIVRFHSIIWPIILMALGEPLPKMVYGHGWLIVEGDKMSKSKGNVVDPLALIDEFGADAIRYFLVKEITLGQDGNFSREALINRINADLANDLGILLHRTLSMIERFHKGIIYRQQGQTELDAELAELAAATVVNYQKHMDVCDLNSALKEIWSLISRANKYIDETAPWALAKDEQQKDRLKTVMYSLVEILRITTILISPFMPGKSVEIWRQLGLGEELSGQRLSAVQGWGKTPEGIKIAKAKPVFPRIEVSLEEGKIPVEKKEEATVSSGTEAQEQVPELTIAEFAKLDLRVAKVLECEKVQGADRLFKLSVDIGSEIRTVVSGIAQHYKTEELIDKEVVMIVNLKPAKIRGIESRGMILAASDSEKLTVVAAPGMQPGAKVK